MAVQEYRRQWGAADEGTEDIEEDKDFHKLQVESDKVALRLVLVSVFFVSRNLQQRNAQKEQKAPTKFSRSSLPAYRIEN
jgi:hypothetical protein